MNSGSGSGSGSHLMALPMGDDSKEKAAQAQAPPPPPRSFPARTMPSRGPQLGVPNPRLFLMVACLWPLALLALFASSAPGMVVSSVVSPAAVHDATSHQQQEQQQQQHHDHTKLEEMKKLLDRADVMGYGPTHPRVAFVVVGTNPADIVESVDSIFATTDLPRIFVVVAVLDDGKGEDPHLVKQLRTIETGGVPKEEEDISQHHHSPKLHVMFHSQRKGLAASRSDAADLIQILVHTHEDAGVKSPDEDILLVLLQAGSTFPNHRWLSKLTPALIVKPPLLELHNHQVAMKLANAISFHTEGPGKRTSLDARLAPQISDAPATDLNGSNGKNFRTPALNGAAIALRLGTFVNLPQTDTATAMDPWSANLDLALNLWLCADGIDIVENLEILPPPGGIYSKDPPGMDQVAKLASVWMDDLFRERFFQSYAAEVSDSAAESPEDDATQDELAMTRVDWETAITMSRRLNSAQQLYKRCRSFEWFIQEVNTELMEILEMELKEDHRFDPAPEDDEDEDENEVNEDGEDEKMEDHHEPPEQAHDAPPEIHPEQDDSGKPKPSKPLRPTNLEIVQKPKMVDISFQDVSGGHEEHPHMPALDADGKPGYIHDETALRKNPPTLNFPELPQACAKHDDNWRMIRQRIVVESDYEQKQNESGQKRAKIFCLVYTIEKFHDRIPNILETWGPKCDGFMVGSTKTDPSIGAVNIQHEGPEEYDNIWQKVRSMWSYIYDNYYDKYDWFHIGGDDLFLIVENLRYYLESEEIRTAANGGIYLPEGNETMQTPLLLGRRFAYQGDMDNIFDSGGSGYTMNKAALKLLVTEGFPNYFPHLKTFSEDTMVARLFKKIDTILPYDTKDDAGGERYMPFAPGHHYSYRLPANPKDDWYSTYSIDIKEGPEHCSPQSVAFHYIKGPLMKRLFALVYGLCPKEESS